MPNASAMSHAEDAPAWVALAVFAQPHGVSGRIKIKSYTDPVDAFAEHATLSDEAGNQIKLKITGHAQGMPIVSVEGVTRRDQAELLRGKKIGVLRSALPPLAEENRYYTDDLIGMEVVEDSGVAFGTVHAVVNYGASDILEIIRPDGASELYAFTSATFPEVNLQKRRITIFPPIILGNQAEEIAV